MQCVTLKTILVLVLDLVAFYKGAYSQRIQSDYVLLKQPYTFPGDSSGCDHAEWRRRHPTDTILYYTIATHTLQQCSTGRGFEEEYRCEDNHLLLKSAEYTDQGQYQFICDGDKTPVHLDVLYALNVHAEETDNITLSCYANNAKDVTWLHNSERVLDYKRDGSVNPEKRASLEKNCFKTGNLSLTITRVRKEDAGIYRCFVDDETMKGNPHTYVLHVSEKSSGPGEQKHCNKAALIALTVVFGLISVISVTHVITAELRKSQSTSTRAARRIKENTTETDRMLKPTSESQSVVHCPVQESDGLGNKPSSTRPII